MTDLDKIRSELKRTSCYDPTKPIPPDLLEQIANELALEWGVDSRYVIDTLEQIASDTADQADDDVTAEWILQSLFDVIAPYHNGNVTRPQPIEYVAFKFPADRFAMNRRDQIQEAAIQECGWPIGTVATLPGQRYELAIEPLGSGRRAYVLRQSDDIFLIPRFSEALSRHIEKRDQAFGTDPDEDDDEQFDLARALKSRFVSRLRGSRVDTIIIDDVAESPLSRAQLASLKRWFGELSGKMNDTAERVRKTMKAFVGVDFAFKEEPLRYFAKQHFFPEPPAAFTAREELLLLGHARNPEQRSRGPPRASETIQTGLWAQPAGLKDRGLRLFRGKTLLVEAMKLEELRTKVKRGISGQRERSKVNQRPCHRRARRLIRYFKQRMAPIDTSAGTWWIGP